ncbi:hypothetical protein [Kitasatospora sp. NPDC085879]|uniref:hypothetical protein n=1 Tax=Kitasatospora sp. NPDC085879 TaxID=3154769 RepID=UPI003436B9DF
MTTRSKLALRFFALPVAGTLYLAVHHKVTTGGWTFPWIFVVVVFPLAALGVWYNSDPGRVMRAKVRRDEVRAQRQREIDEAKNLPS